MSRKRNFSFSSVSSTKFPSLLDKISNMTNTDPRFSSQDSFPFPGGPSNAPSWESLRLTQPVYGITASAALLRFFKKYSVFSGRASRSEYWWTSLWLTGYTFILWICYNLYIQTASSFIGLIVGLLSLGSLALLVPYISLIVRRYHDSNHSGLVLFIPALPFVIGILLCLYSIIAMVQYDLQSGSMLSNSLSGAQSAYSSSGITLMNPSIYVNELILVSKIGLLLTFVGVILNCALCLFPSNNRGIAYDNPRLPENLTVTFEKYNKTRYFQQDQSTFMTDDQYASFFPSPEQEKNSNNNVDGKKNKNDDTTTSDKK